VLSATVLGAGNDASAAEPPAKAGTSTVDLNRDSLEKLCTLKGVTVEIAKAIIGNRCYKKTSDLLDKKVLPTAVFDEIEKHVTVGTECVRAARAPPGGPGGTAKNGKGAGEAKAKGDGKGGG
jgi:hypothetical protein